MKSWLQHHCASILAVVNMARKRADRLTAAGFDLHLLTIIVLTVIVLALLLCLGR